MSNNKVNNKLIADLSKLAKLIAKTINYKGKIKFQLDKPDGTLRKLLDVSRLEKMGWKNLLNIWILNLELN